MLQRSYHRTHGQRLLLPSSYSAPGNVYDALLSAGLTAARSTDTAMWFVADDLSNVWQDSAGTIPCTAAGQAVGRCNDMQYGIVNARLGASALGYHATQPTAGSRPTLVRLTNGRWGLNFGGSNILIVPTPAPSGTGFVGAAARQANIPANNISRILLSIRDGSYSANYRNPQLRATGDTSGSARITVMWRGGGVSSGEVSTANEIALETFLASSVQDAGLSRFWRNGALVNSIASTAAGDGGDNPLSYLGWSALGGWQGPIGAAWSSRNAPADSNRIAIERFAAAHSGAPYSA